MTPMREYSEQLHRELHQRLRQIGEHTGAYAAAATDPMAQLQYSILRQSLWVMSSALLDEGIEPEMWARILDKVIYGCLPQAHVSDERRREHETMAEMLAVKPVKINFPYEGDPR